MNAYLHCLSHTPLVGYVDPEQAVLDEVNGTIADARARIAAFDPELVVLFAPDHYNGFFYDVMPPFCLEEKDKAVMKACAYVLFGILIVINAIQQNFNFIFIALSALVAIYSVYSAVINMIAFSKMKKL